MEFQAGCSIWASGVSSWDGMVLPADPKKKNISDKMIRIILWIIPVISVVVAVCIYGTVFGKKFDIGMQMNVLVGIVFIVLGNYLPKVKQNHSIGLRFPWTLNDSDNWNRTHRFGAWVFIVAGIAMCINGYFKSTAALGVIITVTITVPVLYSYILYRKEQNCPGQRFGETGEGFWKKLEKSVDSPVGT